MDDAMVHASFLPGLPGHSRRDSEILSLCRYLRRVVESSCSLPPLRKRTARMKVANDFELHSYWHVDDSTLCQVVPTWDCGWSWWHWNTSTTAWRRREGRQEGRQEGQEEGQERQEGRHEEQASEDAEVRCAPPALEWLPPADAPRSMHSFASLAAATMK